MKFLHKDIDKFKERQTNETTKKIHLLKKGKAWNSGERTQMPVTIQLKA